MKRIIPCPKCEAKLAVFDLGKPINQKCPKCGNAFTIESEEKKADEKKPEEAVKTPAEKTETAGPAKPEEAKKTEEAAKTPEPAKPEVSEKPGAAPVAAAPAAEDKKPAETKEKEITLKKPADAPAPAAKPRAESKPAAPAMPELPEPHAGGGSMLPAALTIGLLIIVIAMQVISQKRANAQYANLIQHLQYIEKQLAK